MGGLSRFNAPMNRRDFLKSLGGMAASAALPKIPDFTPAAPGLPAAPVPEFVTDPSVIYGFGEGIHSTGGKYANVWLDGYDPEVESMSGNVLREFLKQLNLDKAGRTTPEPHPSGKVGHYAWNRTTEQWHPVVKMPGKMEGTFKTRYLEPGSAIPENAFPVDYDTPWEHMITPEFEGTTEMFQSPADWGKQLTEEWHRHKAWEFSQKGPDKSEMQDPEYRDRYIKHATENRLAPGGRPETPKTLMDSGLPTGNVAIPGADDAGSLPTMIGRLRKARKPAATGIMSLAPLLLAPQGEEQ